MEDNNKDEDNDKDDDNNDKGISVLGLNRDLGFSRGHQGRQGHRPHDDDDNDVGDSTRFSNPTILIYLISFLFFKHFIQI